MATAAAGATDVAILLKRAALASAAQEPAPELASLWELLLLDHAAPLLSTAPQSLAGRAEWAPGAPDTALNCRNRRPGEGRFISMRELCSRPRIITEKVAVLELPACFLARLALWLHIDASVREKIVRWEIVKMQMVHGRHEDGVVVDVGEGRSIRVPLRMAAARVDRSTFAQRMRLMDEPCVRAELLAVWSDIGARGGVNKATYFAMAKEVCSVLLVHLDTRAIHQMVALDARTDLPEWGGVMTTRGFFRYMASLLLVWVESDAASEALNFVRAVAQLWRRRVDAFDMKFATQFGRRDDASAHVPDVPPRALGALPDLVDYAKGQLELSVRLRFGVLHEDVPVVATGRLRRRARRFRDRREDGEPFFMTPESERPRAMAAGAAGDEEARGPGFFGSEGGGGGGGAEDAPAAPAVSSRGSLSPVRRVTAAAVDADASFGAVLKSPMASQASLRSASSVAAAAAALPVPSRLVRPLSVGCLLESGEAASRGEALAASKANGSTRSLHTEELALLPRMESVLTPARRNRIAAAAALPMVVTATPRGAAAGAPSVRVGTPAAAAVLSRVEFAPAAATSPVAGNSRNRIGGLGAALSEPPLRIQSLGAGRGVGPAEAAKFGHRARAHGDARRYALLSCATRQQRDLWNREAEAAAAVAVGVAGGGRHADGGAPLLTRSAPAMPEWPRFGRRAATSLK